MKVTASENPAKQLLPKILRKTEGSDANKIEAGPNQNLLETKGNTQTQTKSFFEAESQLKRVYFFCVVYANENEVYIDSHFLCKYYDERKQVKIFKIISKG